MLDFSAAGTELFMLKEQESLFSYNKTGRAIK
jgi:hypothetical protein